MRRVSAVLETGSPAEARQFADTVAARGGPPRRAGSLAARARPCPTPSPPSTRRWPRPAGTSSAADERLLPFAAPAAAALGRGFASLAPVDRLLGGALRTGALARYAHEGALLVEPRAGRLELRAARTGSRRCPTPTRSGWRAWRPAAAETPRAPPSRLGAWRRGRRPPPATWRAWPRSRCGSRSSTRARGRRSALRSRRSSRSSRCSPTPRRWSDGLRLLAGDLPGADALAHAGEAAERTLAICMQVTGALGFTLEFPLQRAYRRSRAARSWADAVLLSWEAPAR